VVDLAWNRRLVVGPTAPGDGPIGPDQPPVRCSLIDSPTTTQADSEAQLTAVRGCAEATDAGFVHGEAVGPVRMMSPADADADGVLPTVTHEPMAVHETSDRLADDVVTVRSAHVAPPLADVRRIPWPVRAPSRVVEVVPTTVQRAPATPTTGAVVVVVVGAVVVGAAVLGAPGAVVAGGVVVGTAAGTVVGTAPLPVVDPAMHEMPFR
jgi:hypothetical protein